MLMNCKKIDFKAEFGIDGVSGGNTYPFWLVHKELYVKLIGDDPSEFTEMQNGKYKIFINFLRFFIKINKVFCYIC
jgi:hypothetical protein